MRVKQFLKKLEAEHPEGLSKAEMFLASKDLLPVPKNERTWGYLSYVSYWIADSFNLNTFTIASTMITAGLTWWQALICVISTFFLLRDCPSGGQRRCAVLQHHTARQSHQMSRKLTH